MRWFSVTLGPASALKCSRIGLARVGVNVVAIERDTRQFRALTERVSTEDAFPMEPLKQLAEDDKRIALLTRIASRFTKLNPDIMSHFTEAIEVVPDEAVAASEVERGSDPVDAQCVSCPAWQDVRRLDASACAKSECPTQSMHCACMAQCQKCGKNGLVCGTQLCRVRCVLASAWCVNINEILQHSLIIQSVRLSTPVLRLTNKS